MTVSDARAEIPGNDLERFGAAALRLAEQARARLRALVRTAFEVQRKADGSYVTSADVALERELRATIEREFPTHGIVGEELPARLPAAAFQWVLDPIDGTEDFVQRIPTFGTIIGLHYRGAPVVGVIDVPLLEQRAHACFGAGAFLNGERLRLAELPADTPPAQTRLMLAARANFERHGAAAAAAFDAIVRAYPNHRIYRTCYAHMCAATGQVDAMVEYGNKIWDLAATQVLVEEAGGAYRLIEATPSAGGELLAAVFGRPALVARLADMIKNLDR